MVSRIKAEVTRRNLILTPKLDGAATSEVGENAFAVTVTNQSENFASFQVELSTPGVAADAINEWYRIEPQVCAKKPPGASTTFQVVIVRSPIPAYDTTIDLLLRVFSIEYRQLFVTQKLQLTIHKPRQSLVLSLPTQHFKGTPGDRVEIPVLLTNYSAGTVEVRLVCEGLASWVENPQQVLRIDPSYPTQAQFFCQIPADPTLLSQEYPLTIQAIPTAKGAMPPAVKGSLEILPLGMVEFRCTPTHQQIPPRSGQAVAYQIQLQNTSHLKQQVNITASAADQQSFGLALPPPLMLDPGAAETQQVTLHKPRHWFGGKRQFQFELAAEVFEPASPADRQRTRAVPDRQQLDLTVLSRIPNWLLGLLGLLLLLGWLGYLLQLPKHQASVNSVRLDGNASTVFSGSSDRSILRWQVDGHPLRRLTHRLQYEDAIAKNLEKAVRVIRLKPADNNIIAAGLENGTIQLWDVLGNQSERTLFTDNDRVFDLTFSPDSRYLFSGHGSGQVRQWDLSQSQNQSQNQPIRRLVPNPISFSIAALVTYQTRPGVSWIGMAGQFNQLVFWDWANDRVYQVQSDPAVATAGNQYQYIESLAIADRLLVAADNQGNITTWDLSQWQCGVENSDLKFLETGSGIGSDSRQRITTYRCQVPILDRWRGPDGKPVRSVAITQDGVYLASVGDEGRVELWRLEQGRRATGWQNGKTLDRLNVALYGVDIQAVERRLIVTVAAANHQVYAYRVPISQK